MITIKCKDTNLDPLPIKVSLVHGFPKLSRHFNAKFYKPIPQIGIIGGSGLDDPDILEHRQERVVETPYGEPSDALIEGEINGVQCVLLARHGRKHDIMPSNVNYRANIWALRDVGCTHLIVSTACGSLREEIKPGNLWTQIRIFAWPGG